MLGYPVVLHVVRRFFSFSSSLIVQTIISLDARLVFIIASFSFNSYLSLRNIDRGFGNTSRQSACEAFETQTQRVSSTNHTRFNANSGPGGGEYEGKKGEGKEEQEVLQVSRSSSIDTY